MAAWIFRAIESSVFISAGFLGAARGRICFFVIVFFAG